MSGLAIVGFQLPGIAPLITLAVAGLVVLILDLVMPQERS